jgi:hypothetical protein
MARDIRNVVLIGPTDERRTLDRFAEVPDLAASNAQQVQDAFAATGLVSCDGSNFTAHLTGATNVITSAAHGFYTPDCKPRERCAFWFPENPSFTPINIVPATLKSGSCGFGAGETDWATVKLVSNVADVTPYAVPRRGPELSDGMTLLSVSAGDDNFRVNGEMVKNIQTCSLTKAYFTDVTPLETACDTGEGSSGAAQFIVPVGGLALGDAPLTIAAINLGSTITGIDGQPFQSGVQFNRSVPVDGSFLRAIKQNLE